MDKFIPRGKLSKKARKALDAGKRVTWGFSPVSRAVKDRKAYDRHSRAARGRNSETGDGFFIFG